MTQMSCHGFFPSLREKNGLNVGKRGREQDKLTVVLEKLFNQVDVSQHHASTAIPLETELRERIPEL